MVRSAMGWWWYTMKREHIPPAALTRCTSCQVECMWTTTEAGRPLLVDVGEGVAGGNLALIEQPIGTVRSRVLKPGLAFGNRTLHLAHFATCPNASAHRRRGGRRARAYRPT